MKYRLKPTKKQARLLERQLDECRWLSNHFLAERKTVWEEHQESVSYYGQKRTLPGLKAQRESLHSVHSQVLQDVAMRIDLAFKAFFRRVKAGEEPGYPRFRGTGRYDSMTFPQYGNGCQMTDKGLKLSKVGTVRMTLHRPLEGTPKTCTIRHTSTGKWFATISCDVAAHPLPAETNAVGIDVGLESFATLSTGEKVSCPKFLRRDEKDLKRAQRRLSKEVKGTSARRQRRKIVARIHERIANRRTNFCHQEARKIVNRFGLIAVENLAVNAMVHNHCLAKSIIDAAWSQYHVFLAYKAAYAGRAFVKITPAYTSQDCSRCGHRQFKPLAQRVHLCACCGLSLDRDHNAALNILTLGQQSLGRVPRSPRL